MCNMRYIKLCIIRWVDVILEFPFDRLSLWHDKIKSMALPSHEKLLRIRSFHEEKSRE